MSSSHIVNDPVHGVMTFDNSEKNLIKTFTDNPRFQRLRRIKQLGCGDLVFPGAVHTRFNHCFGACYLAKKLCLHLDIKGEQKNIIMIAALLHDIGHGPFSHAFEKIYKNDLSDKNKEFGISHDDDWLIKFISEYDKDQAQAKFIKHFFENKSDQHYDIISSQLDIDRMDYLLRDSHFCGVPYGQIDLKWILSCITFVEVSHGKYRLGITKKGVGALEHYITARRLMTRNIYYHGKKNAAEYYVREFIIGLKDEHLNNKMLKETALGKFLAQYQSYVENINNSNDSKKKDTYKSKFIKDSFVYYSQMTDDDVWICMRNFYLNGRGKCKEIAQRLLFRELPSYYYLNPSRINYATMIIEDYRNNLAKNNQWKIYLDTLDFISYKGEKSPIFIKENNSGSNIYHESELLHHLSDRNEVTYFLYLDKDIDGKKLISELKKNYCLKSPDITYKK
jgi:HD superfamily phosphohydrolase